MYFQRNVPTPPKRYQRFIGWVKGGREIGSGHNFSPFYCYYRGVYYICFDGI